MTLHPATKEAMNLWDSLQWCGVHEQTEQNPHGDARDEVSKLCEDQNIEETLFGGRAKAGQEEAYLKICKEVWAKWHTTKKFKVGDKVYVQPDKDSRIESCIRSTIIAIRADMGYMLKAFQTDLPGIWMFNIWDKDLLPRKDKSKKLWRPAI